MVTTTALARNGTTLSYAHNVEGWYGYINDADYPQQQQQHALVERLLAEQRDEFNALLPADCSWSPGASEIVGPVGTDIIAALDQGVPGHDDADVLHAAMEIAVARVTERIEEIEQEALQQ